MSEPACLGSTLCRCECVSCYLIKVCSRDPSRRDRARARARTYSWTHGIFSVISREPHLTRERARATIHRGIHHTCRSSCQRVAAIALLCAYDPRKSLSLASIPSGESADSKMVSSADTFLTSGVFPMRALSVLAPS